LTTDLATGLTTAITKDGQTTTTARITFAQGVTSSLVTDSSSVSTGSIITGGGVGIAKNLYVGVNANVAGTLGVTGVATFSAAPIYSSLTASSAVATDASKGLVSVTNTGTGNNVLATSPTLVTPILGTPTSATLTNATGLPLSTGVTGTLPEANGGTGTSTGYYGFKNRIINGAMVIDQRNAGASTNNAAGSTTYALDRWAYYGTSGSKFSIQQSTTVPAGFSNSILITSLAATTIGTGDEYWLTQKVEGFNTADLGWGTADAKTVTLSFWVRSSLTGTFGGSFINSAFNYYYAFSYTISSANTWTQVSITVAGPTAGTWIGSTNGVGLSVVFGLSAGSTYGGATPNVWTSASYKVLPTGAVNILATNGATFYITGVQLEKGSTATSFDYRPYGTELQLCQRYYWQAINGNNQELTVGWYYSTTQISLVMNMPVPMRTGPTLLQVTGTGYFTIFSSNTSDAFNSLTIENAGTTMVSLLNSTQVSGTAGTAGLVRATNASSYLGFTAEL
jgi:hypothetical protein